METPITLVPHVSEFQLESVERDDLHRALTFVVASTARAASCPECGQPSHRQHSRYWRTVADLPWAEYTAQVRVALRKWRGRTTGCRRRIFCERLPLVTQPRGRRTARLIILGEGRQRQVLTTLISTLNLTAEVILPGFVQNLFPYMAHASVFVLSSVTEGFPGVLVEAMACGCPVVSTDCPTAEILEGGTYGPLVPVGNDAALADAILSVLDAPPDPHLLRERVAQFSVERAAARYLDILLGAPEQQPDLTRGE